MLNLDQRMPDQSCCSPVVGWSVSDLKQVSIHQRRTKHKCLVSMSLDRLPVRHIVHNLNKNILTKAKIPSGAPMKIRHLGVETPLPYNRYEAQSLLNSPGDILGHTKILLANFNNTRIANIVSLPKL